MGHYKFHYDMIWSIIDISNDRGRKGEREGRRNCAVWSTCMELVHRHVMTWLKSTQCHRRERFTTNFLKAN